MSTVVFVGQYKPEKNLVQETVYKYYPDAELKEKIVAEVKKNDMSPILDDKAIIEINVTVTFKEYVSKNTGV